MAIWLPEAITGGHSKGETERETERKWERECAKGRRKVGYDKTNRLSS